MMNNALLFMCLMGSLMYLSYLLMCKVFKQSFSPGLRMCALTIAGCFYLIPFPLFIKNYLNSLIEWINCTFHLNIPFGYTSSNIYTPASKQIIIQHDGDITLPSYSKIFWTIAVLWLLILLSVLTFSILRYHKSYKKLLITSNATNLRCTYRNILGYKKTIQVRTLSENITPFEIGYWKPIIYLSEKQLGNAAAILEHETTHIRHFHNFIKFIAFITAAVHWYCPLNFFYFLSVCNTLEMLCDSRILKKSSENKRLQYAYLLMGLPASKEDILPHIVHFSGFQSLHYRFIKERLLMIKHHPKFSIKTIVAIVVLTVICALPVAAYNPPVTLEVSDNISYDISFPDGIEFYEDTNPEDILFNFDKGDIYFISESGKTYYDISIEYPNTTCKHNYITGTINRHQRYSDGNCKVVNYNGKRCGKCGNTVFDSKIGNSYYNPCSH